PGDEGQETEPDAETGVEDGQDGCCAKHGDKEGCDGVLGHGLTGSLYTFAMNNVYLGDYPYLPVEEIQGRRGIGVRAHAAAFGFSSPEHVVNALKVMHADAFFLLENRNDKAR